MRRVSLWLIATIFSGVLSLSGAGAEGLDGTPDALPDDGLDFLPERPSGDGNIAIGLWYGNEDGVGGSVELSQDRLFGTDEDLRFSAEGSKSATRLNFTLTDEDFMEGPYARILRASAAFVSQDTSRGRYYGYDALDFSMVFERHLESGLSYRFGGGYQEFELSSDPATRPQAMTDHINTYGNKTKVVYALGGVDLNRAENARVPGRGYRLFGSAELGYTSGAHRYLKLSGGGEMFTTLAENTVLRTHGAIGQGWVDDGNALPLFKSFRGGGVGSVRGYGANTLGPVSPVPGGTNVAYVGGLSAFSAGVEMIYQVPSLADLDLIAFVDIGGVAASHNPFDDTRSSAGVGVNWQSPAGPVSLYLAKAINPGPNDITEVVQFTYGVRF